jgi:hypothetical protein
LDGGFLWECGGLQDGVGIPFPQGSG